MAFMEAGGIPALARVLTAEQQLPRAVRFALAAVEGLMLACPASACEALLGWWRPTTDEADQDLQTFRETAEADGAAEEGNIKASDDPCFPYFTTYLSLSPAAHSACYRVTQMWHTP